MTVVRAGVSTAVCGVLLRCWVCVLLQLPHAFASVAHRTREVAQPVFHESARRAQLARGGMHLRLRGHLVGHNGCCSDPSWAMPCFTMYCLDSHIQSKRITIISMQRQSLQF
eukprot:7681-Heterococcus_DN1.PRE.3